jgi:tripartite-type tricarboxylate transporter receptor subunit TctC
VVGRKLEVLTEDDNKPFAGCYVNATIRLWAQDNQYGKRINAQLRAVQYVKDGAAFKRYVQAELVKWTKLIKESNVKAD